MLSPINHRFRELYAHLLNCHALGQLCWKYGHVLFRSALNGQLWSNGFSFTICQASNPAPNEAPLNRACEIPKANVEACVPLFVNLHVCLPWVRACLFMRKNCSRLLIFQHPQLAFCQVLADSSRFTQT